MTIRSLIAELLVAAAILFGVSRHEVAAVQTTRLTITKAVVDLAVAPPTISIEGPLLEAIRRRS